MNAIVLRRQEQMSADLLETLLEAVKVVAVVWAAVVVIKAVVALLSQLASVAVFAVVLWALAQR
jgi:hypothetical protein